MATNNTGLSAVRIYQIGVGSEDVAFKGSGAGRTVTAKLTTITDMQFNMTATYTTRKKTSSSDMTQINIYNLSPSIQKKFTETGAVVMVKAGYMGDYLKKEPNSVDNPEQTGQYVPADSKSEEEAVEVDYDKLPVIYLGTILYGYSVKKGVDLVTTVFCSNDKIERVEKKTSSSFPQGVKKRDIMRQLVADMGMTLSASSVQLGEDVYKNGWTAFGNTSEQLEKFCSENGLRWFCYNKQIKVFKPAQKKGKEVKAWLITPRDIIDSLEPFYKREKKTKKGLQPPKYGVRCRVYLDGRISLGDYVEITEVPELSGVYQITSLTHRLDFLRGGWETNLELEAA